MPETVSVEVYQLRKSYISGHERRDLFSDVSFTLQTGEFVALQGRSGSGKTTLLNILSGIDVPDAGEVRLGDQSLHSMGENRRARFRLTSIGLVFQFFHLLPTLTLKENILLPARFLKDDRSSVASRFSRLIEATGLTPVMDQYPHEVSGGEAQRAAIARALINQPALLLADEPTGNLDWKTAKSILTLLRDLQKDFPLTILMVTHEADIHTVVDRTLHLRQGVLHC